MTPIKLRNSKLLLRAARVLLIRAEEDLDKQKKDKQEQIEELGHKISQAYMEYAFSENRYNVLLPPDADLEMRDVENDHFIDGVTQLVHYGFKDELLEWLQKHGKVLFYKQGKVFSPALKTMMRRWPMGHVEICELSNRDTTITVELPKQKGNNVLTGKHSEDLVKDLSVGLSQDEIHGAYRDNLPTSFHFDNEGLKKGEVYRPVRDSSGDSYVWHVWASETEFNKFVSEKAEEKAKKDPRVHVPLSLPVDLNSDQLAILRWMELNSKETISVKELKSLPIGQTPWVTELVKKNQGKDVTRSLVLQPTKKDWADWKLAEDLVQRSSVYFTTWDGLQVMWTSETNHAFVLWVDKDNLEVKDIKDKDLINTYVKETNHPSLFGKLTVGWVRYTEFGSDIWIDEVQSDLPKIISNPKLLAEFKDINFDILNRFVAEMRGRGHQRFFMPTYPMKKDAKLYGADPPLSTYQDVPRKMRFRMKDTGEILDTLGLYKDVVTYWKGKMKDHAQIWVLAGKL